MAMIEVEKLTKKYRDRVAINELTFSINEGEIVGFLGPNGAGKSTTMKILTGFMPATSGKARVAGFDVFENPLEAKKRIGYLPETPPLYPEMTVREYLKFVASLKAVPSAKLKGEVDRVCAVTAITSEIDRLTGSLSKGYRQRVGIAQALIGEPALLILDEPTEGLDPKQRQDMLNLIKGLAGKHTVVISTHILSEIEATCQKVLIVHKGQILADDTMANMTQGQVGMLQQKFVELTSASV